MNEEVQRQRGNQSTTMLAARASRWAAGLLVVSAAIALPVAAQQTHLIVVQGLSGEPQYRKQFDSTTALVRNAAVKRWNVADSNITILSETANPATRVDRASKENVAAAFIALSRRVRAGDVVLVMLLGHGSGEGPASKVNLPGVDPTAADFASWLSGLSAQTVVFVNAASGSGDFVSVLKAPGRIVVTATRSAMERNESIFSTHFATGLASDASDSDKDGRVSVMEAFRYAKREVARVYEATNRMQTEHAQVSDSILAARVAFGGAASSSDPRITALVAERQVLESEVASLRSRKASMSADEYDKELERLLLAIAEKTKAIRAAGGKP
ncbi:MAG: hypothetical protein ABIW79_03465 [Gemmatimonas sp.]